MLRAYKKGALQRNSETSFPPLGRTAHQARRVRGWTHFIAKRSYKLCKKMEQYTILYGLIPARLVASELNRIGKINEDLWKIACGHHDHRFDQLFPSTRENQVLFRTVFFLLSSIQEKSGQRRWTLSWTYYRVI